MTGVDTLRSQECPTETIGVVSWTQSEQIQAVYVFFAAIISSDIYCITYNSLFFSFRKLTGLATAFPTGVLEGGG